MEKLLLAMLSPPTSEPTMTVKPISDADLAALDKAHGIDFAFKYRVAHLYPAIRERLRISEAILSVLFSDEPLKPGHADLYEAWRSATSPGEKT
jgi:hypothetical protein